MTYNVFSGTLNQLLNPPIGIAMRSTENATAKIQDRKMPVFLLTLKALYLGMYGVQLELSRTSP